MWASAVINLHVESRYSESLAEKLGFDKVDVRLIINNAAGIFEYREGKGGDFIEVVLRPNSATAKLNGSTDISNEDREKHRLKPENLSFYRDYYCYLFGLPMKLTDPGAIVDPEVRQTTFQDANVLAVRVTYDPEVGSHTWYFYIDPNTYALVGYRFYKDQTKNDGEYIVLTGEVYHRSGLRLPKLRDWYMNDDESFIGADEILSVDVVQ